MKYEPYLEIYDFETTDLFNPEVTQVGLLTADKNLDNITLNSEFVKPKGKISFTAMGITGITPEMLENEKPYEEVMSDESYLASNEDTTYVASYNWDFDKQFIPENWLVGKKTICLLKLARMLVDKQESGDHKLSTLWYYFGHYKDKDYGNAHCAKVDVTMTLDVLKSMLSENNLTLDEAYILLYDPTVCKGGKKYERGTPWETIVKKDYDYVEYILQNTDTLYDEEKSYLEKLLSENESVKQEQVKICTKSKHLDKPWVEVVKEDINYVNFLVEKGYLKGDELEYVKSLI